jgi:hypothetical protein
MAEPSDAPKFVRANEVAGLPPSPKLKKKCEGCGRTYETANRLQRFCWSGCKGQQEWNARRTECFQRATSGRGKPVTYGTGKGPA